MTVNSEETRFKFPIKTGGRDKIKAGMNNRTT